MSVTFGPAYVDGDVKGFEILCDGCAVAEVDTYREAKVAADAHEAVCRNECVGIGPEIRTITDVPALNVHNSGAYQLLTLLGADVRKDCDLCGELPADTFLAHVQVALALNDDRYASSRLHQLAAIARWAQKEGRSVVWE
jgi:hypothetical protein